MNEHPAVTFLLAAHQKAEETAQAAASASYGEEWTDGGLYGEDVHVSDGVRMHIALHDPAAVLRRVAAERKLLAEHQTPGRLFPVGASEGRLTVMCVLCRYHPYLSEDPCRTVLLLAEAWGWQEASQ